MRHLKIFPYINQPDTVSMNPTFETAFNDFIKGQVVASLVQTEEDGAFGLKYQNGYSIVDDEGTVKILDAGDSEVATN